MECSIHIRPSATAEKILGAERKPNGNAVSMYIASLQRIPSSKGSQFDAKAYVALHLRGVRCGAVRYVVQFTMRVCLRIDVSKLHPLQ